MTDDRLAAEVAKWLQHRVDSGLKPDSISAMSELMMLVAQKYYAGGYGPRHKPLKSPLTHKNCGGILTESWTDPYIVQNGDGVPDGKYPRIICLKCGTEVAGDTECELEQ